MKYILFIVVLTINLKSYSCCFSINSEEVRHSLLNPENFRKIGYDFLFYTPSYFYFESSQIDYNLDQNVSLWFDYCNQKVKKLSIYEIMNSSNLGLLTSNSNNEFIKYLYKKNDFEAINYLKFMFRISKWNTFYYNAWELEKRIDSTSVKRKINGLIDFSKQCKHLQIKKRYLHAAIRLAYYSNFKETVADLYVKNFKDSSQKDVIDYWAMYFYAEHENNKIIKNLLMAKVFEHAIDKKNASFISFDSEVEIHQVLKLAKNNSERASVYLIYALKKHSESAELIQQYYKTSKDKLFLNFLIVRELNKIEDWIYTPSYSMLQNSISLNYESYDVQYQVLNKSIQNSKSYLNHFLNFVLRLKTKNKQEQNELKLIQFHGLVMSNQLNAAKMRLNAIDTNSMNLNQKLQFKTTKAWFYSKKGEYLKVRTVIESQKEILSKNLMFSIAKELEKQGLKYEAMFYFQNAFDQYLIVKSKRNLIKGINTYFMNWEEYIDIQYSISDLKYILNHKNNFPSFFNEDKSKEAVKTLNVLLGQKYMRLFNYEQAKIYFSKNDIQNLELNYNPFYADFHNGHFSDSAKQSILITDLIDKVIKIKSQSEHLNTKNRAYCYFLLGNFSFNLSHYGNSRQLVRSGEYMMPYRSSRAGDADYIDCQQAITCYLKASQLSKNKVFSALCLKMAAKCVQLKNNSIAYLDYNVNYSKLKNPYLKRLNQKYPKYANEFESNCMSYYRILELNNTQMKL